MLHVIDSGIIRKNVYCIENDIIFYRLGSLGVTGVVIRKGLSKKKQNFLHPYIPYINDYRKLSIFLQNCSF